ncbi:Uncharacterized protein TPAR_06789 [Tolypocladium paradoxum]|uniref:Protein AAR2 n=1 Tax=Tolypocladium paradoxum TaxID=94208 RepID=A0A2S4KS70_9HYPO|nr:Uncharacterized protein TPAR_06789 [Tolypocladium paradoxum]
MSKQQRPEDMEAGPSSPGAPNGITKSNSNASAGSRSTKSYESIKVIGRYALGTLRLVSHDDPPDPPARQSPRLSMVARNCMTHNLGRGDVVIVLHLPENYPVRYDAASLVSRKFAGIRELPAGPHFFWALHPDGLPSRSGFWIMSSGINQVHVVQWHEYNEVFVPPTRAETRIQAEAVEEIYAQLPPYRDSSAVGARPGELHAVKPSANEEIWEQLTGSITASALDRIAAEQEGGWNVHTSDRVAGAFKLPIDIEGGTTTFSHPVFQSHELKFCFRQGSRAFSNARLEYERSMDARDSSSFILSKMNDTSGKGVCEEDMVGEFQFLYIVGMYLANDACIQQWWFTVLRLVFKAYSLAIRQPSLMAAFLRSIIAQVTHNAIWLAASMFEYNAPNSRDLRVALVVYKRRLAELLKAQDKETVTPDHLAVEAEFSRLETVLSSELGWDLKANYLRRGKVTTENGERLELELGELEEEERGDWVPRVVQRDELSRQLGLLKWKN